MSYNLPNRRGVRRRIEGLIRKAQSVADLLNELGRVPNVADDPKGNSDWYILRNDICFIACEAFEAVIRAFKRRPHPSRTLRWKRAGVSARIVMIRTDIARRKGRKSSKSRDWIWELRAAQQRWLRPSLVETSPFAAEDVGDMSGLIKFLEELSSKNTREVRCELATEAVGAGIDPFGRTSAEIRALLSEGR
jgi:hypothetical protein